MGNCPISINCGDEMADYRDVGQAFATIYMIYFNILKDVLEVGNAKTCDRKSSCVPPA
jgi:hypothetical protein